MGYYNNLINMRMSFELVNKNTNDIEMQNLSGSYCRELLANDLRYTFDKDRLTTNNLRFKKRFLRNNIIVSNYNLWMKYTRDDLKPSDIEKMILLFAGVTSNILFKNNDEYLYRKELKRTELVVPHIHGVEVSTHVNFLSLLMYSSNPIFSLLMLLIRVGFNVAVSERNREIFEALDKSFSLSYLRKIVKEHDREASWHIWDSFLRDFGIENHLPVLGLSSYNDFLKFTYKYGVNLIFPFEKLKSHWRRYSQFYGISNYLTRVPFLKRVAIRQILERLEDGR